MSEYSPNDHQPIEMNSEADLAALVTLAGLPHLTPSRFWSLVELDEPAKVWDLVASGNAPRHGGSRDAAHKWPGWCQTVSPSAELDRHRTTDTHVLLFGHDGYPDALLEDPDPPPVLFRRGPGLTQDCVRVAIVGTRMCTDYGSQVARQLGSALAQRGVDVVSGLAAGIDAAAHAGAILVSPERAVAVVANGVDVVYPQRNRGLYHQIGNQGALISEWPLGANAAPWRFPARNRIVAALSAAVVVVESATKGGSLYTVDEALQRDRAVFAVPGSIYSTVSAGTNKLIADGAHALHDFDELLDAVAPATAASAKPVQMSLDIDSWLLDLVGWEPADLDGLVQRSERSPSEVTLEVERLIGAGALRRTGAIVRRVV